MKRKRSRSSSSRKRRRTLTSKVNTLSRKVRTIAKDTKDLRYADIGIGGGGTGSWSYGTGVHFIHPLDLITQGDSEFGEFEGGTISMKRVQLKFAAEGASAEHDICRIIIWIAKEETTAPTTMEGILPFWNIGAIVNSPWDLNKSGQYKIIYDKRFLLTEGGYDPTTSTQVVTSATPHYKLFDINLPIPKKYQVAHFDQHLGKFTKNVIHIAFMSDSTTIPHPGPPDSNGLLRLIYTA